MLLYQLISCNVTFTQKVVSQVYLKHFAVYRIMIFAYNYGSKGELLYYWLGHGGHTSWLQFQGRVEMHIIWTASCAIWVVHVICSRGNFVHKNMLIWHSLASFGIMIIRLITQLYMCVPMEFYIGLGWWFIASYGCYWRITVSGESWIAEYPSGTSACDNELWWHYVGYS